MAVTSYKLPTSVIQNGTGVNAWADPNNILLVDGDFAVASGPASEILVGGFNISLGQLDTITNITLKVKGYRGSFNTTLAIYAVDDTSGVEISYPYTPSFQGFGGTNTLYTLASSLFGTTWTPDQINNIKLKLVADGTLYLDSVELAVTYTPGVTPVPPAPSSGQVVVDEFVQGIRFQLAQAMTSSDLYMFAESFTMPDGTPIEYADFHGEALITVDQGILGSEENIRISNVEHDYNGTGLVRLTIDSLADRGLGFIYPYDSDATRIKAHGGTAEFVISNSAPFYNRFLRKNQIDALVSAPIYVEDESVALTDPVHTLDFQGSGVSVANDSVDSFKKIVTITGGGGSGHEIQDNGVAMPTEPALNFIDYFTLTDVPGVSTDVAIDVVGLAGDTTFINTLTSNVNFQNAVNTFVSGSGVLQIDQTPDNGNYGAITGVVDGTNDTFIVSQGEYLAGKIAVYLNGLIQLEGASDDFVESDPSNGEFKFNTPPDTGDIITVVYTTTAATVDNYTVKATTADTTPSFLDDKIEVVSTDNTITVTPSVINPGANEKLRFDLAVDTSTLASSLYPTFLYAGQGIYSVPDTAFAFGVSNYFRSGNSSNAPTVYKFGAFGRTISGNGDMVPSLSNGVCHDYSIGKYFSFTKTPLGGYDFTMTLKQYDVTTPGAAEITWTCHATSTGGTLNNLPLSIVVDKQDLKLYITMDTSIYTQVIDSTTLSNNTTYVFDLQAGGGTITSTATSFTGAAKFPQIGTSNIALVNSTTKKFITKSDNNKYVYSSVSGITSTAVINYGDYSGTNIVALNGILYKANSINSIQTSGIPGNTWIDFIEMYPVPTSNTILNT